MTTTNMFLNFGGKWDSPPQKKKLKWNVCGLQSKMYSILKADDLEECKPKGAKNKCLNQKHIHHKQYKDALLKRKTFWHCMDKLGSQEQHMTGYMSTRSHSHRWTPRVEFQIVESPPWHTGTRISQDLLMTCWMRWHIIMLCGCTWLSIQAIMVSPCQEGLP